MIPDFLRDPQWPIWFVVCGLATWRLTSIVQLEDIMIWFRSLMGVKHHEDPEQRVYPKHFIGQLLSCFWCSSVWVSIPVYLVWGLGFQVVLLPFAISAIAIAIQEARYHLEWTRKQKSGEAWYRMQQGLDKIHIRD